ncbi:MAG TPA: Rne/Rng family ribonuclease [Rhizomicrobium sp.]|nr:Rne/Rng family ribonuclease [Rhizomicrobium sp.]
MPRRMLIDASHREETRVVVLDGQKVEEFDFEAASKRPLKGNIYLAKVTRVEPSLQAAFVEYGGNKQGFLAFPEIHPDYYQIPVADRIALLAEQEAEARRRADDDVESFDIVPGPKKAHAPAEDENAEANTDDGAPDSDEADEQSGDDARADARHDETAHEPDSETSAAGDDVADTSHEGEGWESNVAPPSALEEHEESAGGPEVMSEVPVSPGEDAETGAIKEETGSAEPAARPLQAQKPTQRWVRKRHYKIQEVIKRRQIILVQVVKEERGNKGAALTTYLSLAGRYCVLMPNTPRGGGISRKITNATDRKRLKSAAQALELPEGMGLIIRTAGENRTKVEIKRDYEYLLRTWDAIRELTLKSNAPACVYEEGDLIKRAIRDLYNKDVGEIVVEGDDGYRNAKEFMRMLMPSHAKNVKLYKEPTPLFHRHHIEAQLDAMFSPTVTLKSGGYIVINQTEALVSIDVNSGRATREHSIEDTARKTNLEAADEIGRQLRLRDLAGLIVIDFIDMEDSRNDRDVERRIREAVKNDRARVQIGKISQFGLLEMSRQRLRAGVIAGSTVPCPHCGGQGIVRSVESTALRLLRGLEEEGQKLVASSVDVRVASDVAIYTLNQKRRELARIESDYGMIVTFTPKDGLMAGTFEIERIAQKSAEDQARFSSPPHSEPVLETGIDPDEDVQDHEDVLAEAEEPAASEPSGESSPPSPSPSKRRRRRRGGRGRGSDRQSHQGQQPHPPSAESSSDTQPQPATARSAAENPVSANLEEGTVQPHDAGQAGSPAVPSGAPRKRRRRRGRRGGGHGAAPQSAADNARFASSPSNIQDRFGTPDDIDTTPHYVEPSHDPEPGDEAAEPANLNGSSEPVWSLSSGAAAPPSQDASETQSGSLTPAPVAEVPSATSEPVPEKPSGPPKKGWWQRTFRSEN